MVIMVIMVIIVIIVFIVIIVIIVIISKGLSARVRYVATGGGHYDSERASSLAGSVATRMATAQNGWLDSELGWTLKGTFRFLPGAKPPAGGRSPWIGCEPGC
jgi:hypothetical protein